jgi:abortive infection bacteriophage resistance protein
MVIADQGRAESNLRRIGYYRLSGYWYPFRASVQLAGGGERILDTIRPQVEFETVVELYIWDGKLRLLLLDAIERVEVALRASIALRHGQRGGFAYRDPLTLDGVFARRVNRGFSRTRHEDWLMRVEDAFARSKEDFANHFRAKYSGHPPIWIAVETWEYGTLSVFFSGMDRQDRDAIAAEYNVSNGAVLASWFRTINHVRNIAAHHCRLWNKPLVDQPRFPGRGIIANLDHLIGNTLAQTRLYGAVAILRYLLLTIAPTNDWQKRLYELTTRFPRSPYIDLGRAGFPHNWFQLSLWR